MRRHRRALQAHRTRPEDRSHWPGLNISEADWNSSAKYLVGALDQFKVPEKERTEEWTAVSGLKGDIVGG